MSSSTFVLLADAVSETDPQVC